MARVRQARRCRARRKNGEHCKAFAIAGGYVCRMHGGASPRALHAAYVRRFEADFNRKFASEYARWQREVRDWQVRRILITAELLGMSPEQVRPGDIGYCRAIHDQPAGPETEPKMRPDRRFRPAQPPPRRRKAPARPVPAAHNLCHGRLTSALHDRGRADRAAGTCGQFDH
ncbi:MAG TPA: hypothetical protein VK586_24205 [Streptosporangiaceae bacterium]|nr:hypothetical protein [Streptosporangiaceae bacterium]